MPDTEQLRQTPRRVGPSSPGKPHGRLESVDALRGIAALAVVLCHATGSLPPSGHWLSAVRAVLVEGHQGVPLFFVISGFCIHLTRARALAQKTAGAPGFFAFWRRRFYRLYPPYFVLLCVSMGLMVVAYWLGRGGNLYPEPKGPWMAADFLAHVLMLHGLHPVLDVGAGNPGYWTLAREEYFYLLYFALLTSRSRFGALGTTAAVLFLGLAFRLVMSFVLPADSPWLYTVNTSAIVLWFQWCLGMVAVEAYFGLVRLPAWCRSLWLFPAWVALAEVSQVYCTALAPVLWGMAFFTLINHCVTREKESAWPRTWWLAGLAAIGLFSYSLYLVHPVVLNCLYQVVPGAHSAGLRLLRLAFMVGACVLAGWLYFLLVERRFLNGGKPRPAGAPAVEPEPAGAVPLPVTSAG